MLFRSLLVEHPFDVLAIFDKLELIRDQLADLAIDAPDRLVDRADRALLFVTQEQLVVVEQAALLQHLERQGGDLLMSRLDRADRKSVGEGKSVSVRVALRGRRIIKQQRMNKPNRSHTFNTYTNKTL